MKTELPDFLLEMSRQMNNQDNRCTSDAVYQVRQHQYFVTEEGYNEHHFILTDDDGEFFRSDTGSEDSAKDHLLDYCEETCSDWVAENHEDELNDGRDIRELFIEKFDLSEDIEDFHDEVKKLAVQQIDVVLHTCFTEKEALAIAGRYHESQEVFTYGVSLYFTEETKQLRNWIKSLVENQEKQPSNNYHLINNISAGDKITHANGLVGIVAEEGIWSKVMDGTSPNPNDIARSRIHIIYENGGESYHTYRHDGRSCSCANYDIVAIERMNKEQGE